MRAKGLLKYLDIKTVRHGTNPPADIIPHRKQCCKQGIGLLSGNKGEQFGPHPVKHIVVVACFSLPE
jgi:hypothetical protein